MTNPKKNILLTNDDGFDAAGLQALYRALSNDSWNVLIVAPLSERSGAGCSLSLSNEMKVVERRDGNTLVGYLVDGTPADCVKFATMSVTEFKPDFVLSGINRGLNAGNSVFYSGTVAGAIEATLFGIPAMACSLACWGYPEAFYEDAAQVVTRLLPWLVAQPNVERTLWNMNIPNRRSAAMGRVRLTSHGTSFFVDEFEQFKQDAGARYFRNVGSRLVACNRNTDSDDRIVQEGDVSLSLLRTDLTVSFSAHESADLESTWAELLGDRASADAAK